MNTDTKVDETKPWNNLSCKELLNIVDDLGKHSLICQFWRDKNTFLFTSIVPIAKICVFRIPETAAVKNLFISYYWNMNENEK